MAASVGLGLVCAAASVGIRAALTPLLGGEEHFVALFPILLLASFYGGVIAGVSCLLTTLLAAWYLFLGPPRSFVLGPHEGAGLIALLVSGAWIVAGAIAVRQLIQRLREANEAEHRLARELQHRVKNNLAVVEALVAQSARGAGDLPTFLERFLGRMKSLSAAQVLLSRHEHAKAEIEELVGAVLAPFDASGRLSWSGENIQLRPQQAVALALCLHELATNSLKYGALSREEGRVSLAWSRADGALARIDWRERGGPPVRQPDRAGSGVRLLRRGLDIGLPAEIAYPPEGVTWSARFRSDV
jgi:two-component sensor histidine kinase